MNPLISSVIQVFPFGLKGQMAKRNTRFWNSWVFFLLVSNVCVFKVLIETYFQDKLVTCAIKTNEAIASAWVQLQAGICKQLLTMEGERQATYMDISAVRVGGKNTSHCPGLRFPQLKLIQLLCQIFNTYQIYLKNKRA